MAFEWLGTFNKSQFERLATYARAQLLSIAGRIQHLQAEKARLGSLIVAKDAAGRPTGYTAPTPASYLGRLVAAYEILGGDVFHDLQIRQMSEPVYLKTGTENAAPKVFSNGEPVPQAGLGDAPTGDLVQQIRAWMSDALDRREYLERKIRRVIDYGDQLDAEVTLLQKIQGAVDVNGSLENLISSVEHLLADPTYRAAIDDKGKDPFGKFSKAPISSFEPGGERTAPEGEGVEKTEGGYYIYGADPNS